LAASVVFAWLYNSGSALVPMLFHGGINPIAAYFPTGGIDAAGTLSGYGSSAIVLVAVLLRVYGPRELADRSRITLGDLFAAGTDTDR
jgi:hypothetical protein